MTREQMRTVLVPRFAEAVCRAAANLGPSHVQLPVAHVEDPLYRERVYCYELYHQLRLELREDELLRGFELNGEVDKRGHPLIRGNPFLDRAKPDLLVHVPGTMDKNLIVLEVKPITSELDLFQKDVEKVTAFITEANYVAGLCLVYGPGEEALESLRRAGVESVADRLPVLANILLIWHEKAGRPARILPWQD